MNGFSPLRSFSVRFVALRNGRSPCPKGSPGMVTRMTAAIGRVALQAIHRPELLHQVISVTPRDLAAPASKVIAFPTEVRRLSAGQRASSSTAARSAGQRRRRN